MPSRPSRSPALAPAATTRASRLGAAVAVLAAVALSLWVHRRTLDGFFAPDDFIYLERASGLLPRLDLLWRVIPGRLWFASLLPVFGPDPRAWFAANLALHAMNVGLLYALVRGPAGPAAAFAAAGLFGVSRLHMTALAQVATVSELLACGLTLGTLLLARRAGRLAALGSGLLFAAALLCKESVALMPLVLMLDARGPWRSRARRAVPLAAAGVAWSAWLAAGGARAVYAGGAYDLQLGANLFHNLMTFAEWTVDLSTPIPDLFGTFSTSAWQVGLPMLVAWIALAAALWRRTRLPAVGLAWWLLALLPVLPLLYHSYLHYLYLPVAGAAVAIAGGLDAWIGDPRSALRRRGVWAVSIVLVAGYAVAGDRLLHERLTARLPEMDLPVDPFARKVEYARRTAEGIAGAVRDGQRRIAFLMPPGEGRAFADVIRATLDDGRALRFLYPTIDSVAYLAEWTPADSGFERFAQSSEGRVLHLGKGAAAALRWAELLEQNGLNQDADRVRAAAGIHMTRGTSR